jgi:hypothetical protein
MEGASLAVWVTSEKHRNGRKLFTLVCAVPNDLASRSLVR